MPRCKGCIDAGVPTYVEMPCEHDEPCRGEPQTRKVVKVTSDMPNGPMCGHCADLTREVASLRQQLREARNNLTEWQRDAFVSGWNAAHESATRCDQERAEAVREFMCDP